MDISSSLYTLSDIADYNGGMLNKGEPDEYGDVKFGNGKGSVSYNNDDIYYLEGMFPDVKINSASAI